MFLHLFYNIVLLECTPLIRITVERNLTMEHDYVITVMAIVYLYYYSINIFKEIIKEEHD